VASFGSDPIKTFKLFALKRLTEADKKDPSKILATGKLSPGTYLVQCVNDGGALKLIVFSLLGRQLLSNTFADKKNLPADAQEQQKLFYGLIHTLVQ
jgi:hypothetical protein